MSARMPALFVGHGTPTNAIDNNKYAKAWEEIGPKNTEARSHPFCVRALVYRGGKNHRRSEA